MRAVTGNELGAPPARRDDLPARTRGAGEVVVPGHAPSVNPIDDGIAAGMAKDMVPDEFPVTLADREDVVNVPSRGEEWKVAEEQAALRRVATLVARGVSQDEVFAAVIRQLEHLVGELGAVDGHLGHRAPSFRLRDRDVVDRLAVTIVNLARRPGGWEARGEAERVGCADLDRAANRAGI